MFATAIHPTTSKKLEWILYIKGGHIYDVRKRN